jgi:hypothetical protein
VKLRNCARTHERLGAAQWSSLEALAQLLESADCSLLPLALSHLPGSLLLRAQVQQQQVLCPLYQTDRGFAGLGGSVDTPHTRMQVPWLPRSHCFLVSHTDLHMTPSSSAVNSAGINEEQKQLNFRMGQQRRKKEGGAALAL